MEQVDLTPVGLEGYKIDRNGTVYSKRGQPMLHQFTGRGYKAIPLNTRKHKGKVVRIDRLMLAAFHEVKLDEPVTVLYKDDDPNNVSLDNLIFKRNGNG